MLYSTTAKVNKVSLIVTSVVYYLSAPTAGLWILDKLVQNVDLFLSGIWMMTFYNEDIIFEDELD